jgi:serine/arginine repetitive matrix protein 2
MSYNGIGLSTSRGTGTNGFVQRNFSHLSSSHPSGKQSFDYTRDSSPPRIAQPNLALITHNSKRKIEIKCLELRDDLEEGGMTEVEIDERVDELRRELLASMDVGGVTGGVVTDRHQVAIEKRDKNARFAESFGVRKDYVHGRRLIGYLPSFPPPLPNHPLKPPNLPRLPPKPIRT